jgi:F-type H+-transporting ATPase subunit gamma
MANLKIIRSKIKSVTSIQKVTKAMKMVAAAKLRKSQENMEKARPYSERIEKLIAYLIVDIDRSLLLLLNKKDTINHVGFIIITADRGLAGSFNTNIIKRAEIEIKKVGKEKSILFCIGKKGYKYFHKRNYNVSNHYKDFWIKLRYNDAITIGKDVINAYTNNTIDSVYVVFNYFKTVGSQEITYNQLLPLEFEKEKIKVKKDIIYEPSKADIVRSLIPKYFNTQIWQYLLESFASEQAARMVAMENATENAAEMIDKLNLEFNKARQSAITTEMLEIVSGAEALSN